MITGPSHWLGAYRSSLLKSLHPFDEGMDSIYWDLDVALTIKALGLVNGYDSDFVGYVEAEEEVLAENSVSHGLSAQRAKQRFADSGFWPSAGRWLFELTRLPFQSWRRQHFWQRFGAHKLVGEDRDYCRRINRLRTSFRLKSEPATGQAPEVTPASTRRAA
jgi:hypothetical protein